MSELRQVEWSTICLVRGRRRKLIMETYQPAMLPIKDRSPTVPAILIEVIHRRRGCKCTIALGPFTQLGLPDARSDTYPELLREK
jgi:hypothetical protein